MSAQSLENVISILIFSGVVYSGVFYGADSTDLNNSRKRSCSPTIKVLTPKLLNKKRYVFYHFSLSQESPSPVRSLLELVNIDLRKTSPIYLSLT